MTLFPEGLVSAMIYGALALTGVALVALLWMILRDYKNKDIW